MNGIQNRKAADTKKPFPGCLGRMVNLFDLSTGVPGNRLLTDKPHRDGSALSRSRSDGARTSPFGDPIDDKAMVPELRRTSNKKSNGMPMKMLIAQEMSREVESKRNTASPSVVAKLMGLDALPQQHSDSAEHRSHPRSYSRSHSGIPLGYWQQEHGFDMEMQHEINQFPEQIEYKDVHEVWQQSQNSRYGRDKSPLKGRHIDNTHDRKMAIVRQKFTEAKRLATDGKLRQSKQFQDALEVLSSNKDLLLKFLQEPNPLFSQHLYDLLSTPASPETKSITVLRPSKMVDNNKIFGMDKKIEKQTQRTSHMDEVTGWDKGNLAFAPRRVDDSPIQPTRIVVLKPSSGKPHDIKAAVSPHSSPPRVLHGEEFCGDLEDDEAQESREVPQEITWQMRENLSRHQRDETLFSPEFSNGYIGDESSFNKSENEYVPGNLSDSEVISPTSRHSWDHVNKFDSPYSSSSFSHASYSPESSVCREAKKRLSERWAMMASNGHSLEPRHVRRSSSTLGEMLALSDTRNFARSEGDGINTEQEPQGSTSDSAGDLHKDDNVDNSPRNLSRSKSIPVSSTGSGGRLNIEVSETEFGKIDTSKEVAKVQAVKSSFKGKVSSLFFSRNKKSSKDKSSASQSKYESQNSSGTRISSSGKSSNGTSQCAKNNGIEEGLLPTLQVSSSKTPSPDLIGLERKQDIISAKPGLSVTKPVVRGNPSENQDQPSPISVLEAPFEEDENVTAGSCHVHPDKHEQTGAKLPAHSLKPNLIDKSPPIESIARTLSWDESRAETATSYPLRPSVISPGTTREEEGEWLFLIQSLLSAGGLGGEVQSDSYFSKWHSPESPLDPSLRDKYVDPDNEELIIHEAKRRQRRSRRRLVFDCVNAALIEITGYGLTTTDTGGVHKGRLGDDGTAAQPMLVDELWGRMKEWFAWEVNCFPGDGGGDDSNSLVVERVVRREIGGKGWAEHMRMERDHIGKEIQGKLLDELVQEAVVELTGRGASLT